MLLPIRAIACLTSLLALASGSSSVSRTEGAGKNASTKQANEFVIPRNVQAIISRHCHACHGDGTSEGDVRFDTLAKLDKAERLDLLNKAQSQLFFGLMPPQDEKQLTPADHKSLSNWVTAELRKWGASKLDEKMRAPDYGNYVNHDALFSGKIDQKAFTPARRWLASPQIFEERVLDVFSIEGRERQNRKQQGFHGVTNPFVLPDHSGVRYYDNTTLDGGHLLVMLTNAEWISGKQIFAARHHGVDRRKIEYPNPKDRWSPQNSPEAFVKIVGKTSQPTSDQMIDAIHTQFGLVLRRRATEDELNRYLELTRTAIELGGNAEGLRQMLKSVLLESEFLYRLEFGAGETDEFGRKKLSPREASFAISYALGDRGPDARLIKAAEEGRLVTRKDYEREVRRLLADATYYRGQIDKGLNGKHLRSHVTSHPRIVRFFREFFGYANSVKLFKDVSRSGGFYDNAGRDYTGTAGSVSNEADRVVDLIVGEDKNVFERLLTTDEFFVLHTHSNEEGRRIVDGWKNAYTILKETGWEDDAEAALLDNFEKHKGAFKKIRIDTLDESRRRIHVRDFRRFMEFFDQTFGKGLTPITFPWFYHGGQKFRYSEIYSLPRVPGGGPIGSQGTYREQDTWDYPVKQPFKVANRKGILTHPAWLLAHSQNTETDPVRRGRWIREKLLAGRVPDVPITVDAQIPEDHHRTLRERLDSVTGNEQCWKCHKHMNPLGLTFEVFDDFGRYRTQESLEHPDNLIERGNGKTSADVYKTKPVDATGALDGTGDPALDGEVADVFDLIDRLAKSERVRQSIIRHAFRFYLGRNEMLSDSKTLIDADRAYVDSGGSFQAVIVSLLTSDSFIYRKALEDRP